MSLRNHKLAVKLDSIGTVASMICAVHCIALPFFIVLLTLYGFDFASGPLFEFVFISASILIGLFTLTHGYKNHHKNFLPALLFISGLATIIISHLLFHEELHNVSASEFGIQYMLTPIGAVMVGAGHYLNRRYSKNLVASECCK